MLFLRVLCALCGFLNLFQEIIKSLRKSQRRKDGGVTPAISTHVRANAIDHRKRQNKGICIKRLILLMPALICLGTWNLRIAPNRGYSRILKRRIPIIEIDGEAGRSLRSEPLPACGWQFVNRTRHYTYRLH